MQNAAYNHCILCKNDITAVMPRVRLYGHTHPKCRVVRLDIAIAYLTVFFKKTLYYLISFQKVDPFNGRELNTRYVRYSKKCYNEFCVHPDHFTVDFIRNGSNCSGDVVSYNILKKI